MFKLEAFVDDKKVVTVMRTLSGMVRDLHMVPVRNATVKKGKVVSAGHATSAIELLRSFIADVAMQGGVTFPTSQFIEHGVAAGLHRTGLYTAIGQAKKEKLIRSKERGVNIIIKQQ